MDAALVKKNVDTIRQELEAYRQEQNAAPTVIAVAKTFSAPAVRAAHAAGVCDIGENYLQEAEAKIAACADLPLTWHFIGAIQKNKTAPIARLFDWVHSVDRVSFAARLSAAREEKQPINILMQVNISDEASKSGIAAADAAGAAREISALPNIRLRGLMILPALTADSAQQYEVFSRTAHLQQRIVQQTGIALDCLSMGMSGDYRQALRAGATHIRLGTAIFGYREKKEGKK